MSLRFILSRSFKNGKYLLQHYYKRQIHTNILENTKRAQLRGSPPKADKLAHEIIKNQQLFKFGQNARRLFIDNILNRVTNPVSSEIRADVTKKYYFGDSAPFFALVGVSLASGNGVLTKDDELEGVCMEIRQAVAHYQNKLEEKVIDDTINGNLKLDRLDIGPPISKGCNAVVYAAALKDQKLSASPIPEDAEYDVTIPENLLSPTEHFQGRFAQDFGGSVDNVYNFSSFSPRTSITSLRGVNNRSNLPNSSSNRNQPDREQRTVQFADHPEYFSSTRQRMSNSSMFSESFERLVESPSLEDADIYRYPLALKMMFNYDVQSNAMAILRAMHKETIPARRRQNVDVENWEKVLIDKSICLPPHPNVVLMFGAFCDQVPNLRYSTDLYPMALPPRLNPSGYGRNMSLFLLMKRYNTSLDEYLANNEVPMRTRILLFAQLLEAVAHINRYGVAHRDLKSDNILIETSMDSAPVLVISDFGCSLADKEHGLKIPYNSDEITKGGNAALMAPEIFNKEPGTFAILNYTKSDLWACGAIAYEIFGFPNPFYQPNDRDLISTSAVLRNSDYDESDLPELSEEVPFVIKKLVENLLQRNPSNRLNPDVAANVTQLYLWAPSSWIKKECNPTSNEILQWLLSLTTKVLCEGSGSFKKEFSNRRTLTEYQLLSSFLSRARLRSIRRALNWIQSD